MHGRGNISVLALPILVGMLWAGLWCAIYDLASLMDALEAMDDTIATALGRMGVFYALLLGYAAVMLLIPVSAWWIANKKRVLLLYALVTPIVVGIALWAWGSHYSVLVGRVWHDWQRWDFALRQLVGMSIFLWIISLLSKRWRRTSPHKH